MSTAPNTSNVPGNSQFEGRSARSRPELLAPAGDRDCIRAAVENGADAVYFGLQHGFNARVRAANLELDELSDVMGSLRQRGVKGYVTLNTLIFSDELSEIEQVVRAVAKAGADAVLVQDLGLVALIRNLCPELPIHASTQMTLTSAESIAVAGSLGVERVVLARELSLAEIRQIQKRTTMPLEVFVHGALCVAYSGQCLTSESLGGRSANRGHCAQACRLPYDLLCDGRDVDLGEMKYLLSPQDLAAYALIPELIDAGICSFKIEGRLKTPEYVANITHHYRRAIDEAWAGREAEFTTNDVHEMELSFSRGFSPGWLQGCDHKMLVPGRSSAKRGVLIGEVRAVRRGRVEVVLSAPLAAGDGVVFEGDREHHQEQGGRVYEVVPANRDQSGNGPRNCMPRSSPTDRAIASEIVELSFQHGSLDFSKLQVGQRIWKTDDPRLTARLRKSFTAADPVRRVALRLQVAAVVGQPLRIEGTAQSGARCLFVSAEPLATARKHPLTEQLLREQLGRLGGSVYELADLQACISGGPMVPLSVLGAARREVVQQLDASGATALSREVSTATALDSLRAHFPGGERSGDPLPAPRLRVLCRSLAQLQSALELGCVGVYVDFQDIREYRQAVTLAHARQTSIFLAAPRIQKPGERGIFLALAKHGADGILVRNLGGLAFCRERAIPFVADFSLNVTNDLTARLLREWGAERVTASYDLNREQLLELVRAMPASWLEVVIHQHMPMFHMEHCVFCAVLSPGTNKTNCGRPCDHHNVQLRDRIGMEHALLADVGCRNTLFNAVPQSAAEVTPGLLADGLREFRLELLNENATEVREMVELYRDLLAGRTTGREVWSRLRATNRVGVTRGTLEERRNPLAIL